MFDVELRDVLVADSIANKEDAASAFAAAVGGFDMARDAWRGQPAEAIGDLRLEAKGLSHLSGAETDQTNLSLEPRPRLEVSAFTGRPP